MAAGDDSSVPLGTPTGNADTRLTGNGDHRQVMVVGNAGDLLAGLDPAAGALQVAQAPMPVLYESWAVLNTTDDWTVTGNTPSLSGGQMQMPSTLSTYNALRSKDAVRPGAGFTYVANGIALEGTQAIGAGRFWGLGTPATTPSATSLCQDAVGFEVDQATGNLYAVTYNGGVRNLLQLLTRPGDAGFHRYAMYHRVTSTVWCIDNLQIPVFTKAWPDVPLQELPALIVRNNAASYTGTPLMVNTAHLTADTGRHGMSIVDPDFGRRGAKVSTTGDLYLRKSTAATSSIYSVAASVTAGGVQIVASNADRLGATVFNDSTAVLYLALGGTVTTTNYTVQVQPGGYYELPNDGCGYVGTVYGIWSAAVGSARVTELRP